MEKILWWATRHPPLLEQIKSLKARGYSIKQPQALRATDPKGISDWFNKQRENYAHPDVIVLAAPKDTTIATILQILPGVEIVTAKMESVPSNGKKKLWQWEQIWFKHEIHNGQVSFKWWKLTKSENSDTVNLA